MTQQFLEGLPKIPVGELPTDSTCMICLNAYGNGSLDNDGNAEDPVRLPCGHAVGFACISIWLSPDNIGQNSCPYCRARFFPAQPRPYMEHELMNNDYDDDDEPDRPVLVLNMHEMTRRVGRIGRRLHGDGGVHIEMDSDSNSQGIYAHFFERTAEQYEESLQRARTISAREWSELNISAETNDPQLAEAMERQIAALAASFRTLAFREMLLYLTLMSERPRGLPRLPALSDPITDLNHEQEDALFLELERQGAFEGDSDRPGYTGLSNRERWQAHREKDGEVWMFQRGVWAGFGAD